MQRFWVAVLFVLSLATNHGMAAVWFEAVDMGVPTNGSVTMTGYRGYRIQAVSDEGALTRVNVGNQNGVVGWISGGIAQRWEDPTSSALWGAETTIHSPGPLSADNSFASEFNFDSHFTFDPLDVTLEPIEAEGFPLASTAYEVVYSGLGFITSGSQFAPANYMPLQSTTSVGYGVGLYPYIGANFAEMRASFRINPSAQAEVFPFAYIVSNSGFDVVGAVSTNAGGNYGLVQLNVQVPEPIGAGAFIISSMGFLSGRTTRCSDSKTSKCADC